MTNKMWAIPKVVLTADNAIAEIKRFTKIAKKAGSYCYGECIITPAVAAKLLTLEQTNRNRRGGVVDTYAEYIASGKWILIPSAVVFDIYGCLIDGGHRLTAIVQSGIPTPLIICCGAGGKVQQIMDQVVPRTVVDMLHLQNKNVTSLEVAVCRSIYTESPASLKVAISKIDIAELVKLHYPVVHFAVSGFGAKKTFNAPVLAPIVRALEAHRNDAKKYAEIERFIGILSGKIKAGLNATTDMIPSNLKEWLSNEYSNKRRTVARRVVYRKVDKCLWAYLHGENISNITEAKIEYFPVKVTSETAKYFDYARKVKEGHGRKRAKIIKMSDKDLGKLITT